MFPGDSLHHRGMAPPRTAIKKLKWWLKSRFEREFKDCGDTLNHGFQIDVTDCGILAANTAAHDVFNDVVWTVERKIEERVQWFLTLSKAHMCEVGDEKTHILVILTRP